MKILTISGSARASSSNRNLLDYIAKLFPQHQFYFFEGLTILPVFNADRDFHPWPSSILEWRAAIKSCDAVIVTTPEYIHNLPAAIKNGLEWLSSSGELQHKPMLPITFTPHPPRGEKAMQSLVWSLQALNARIVTQLDLYQTDLEKETGEFKLKEDSLELIRESIHLLTGLL